MGGPQPPDGGCALVLEELVAGAGLVEVKLPVQDVSLTSAAGEMLAGLKVGRKVTQFDCWRSLNREAGRNSLVRECPWGWGTAGSR